MGTIFIRPNFIRRAFYKNNFIRTIFIRIFLQEHFYKTFIRTVSYEQFLTFSQMWGLRGGGDGAVPLPPM